jgi:hypothetical protein
MAARADFTYEQSTKMTGGAMAGMMRVAGAFSKAAREPMLSTITVKGDKLATISRDRIHVIDLSTETMTDIDLKKQTYSTITFAEMAEAMKRMAAKMSQKQQPAPESGQLEFKADVKQTGNQRVINGLNTKETILTLTLEGTDAKSGEKGSMDMQMDMWMAPKIAGYEEVRDFYMRMSQKIDWSPMSGALGPMMAQNAKGMGQMVKEMSKLEGVPVLQITRIGLAGNGANVPAGSDAQSAEHPAAPSAGDAAQEAAASSVLGRTGRVGALAGGLGGFGGFGRKKKQKEQEEVAAAPPPPPSAAASAPSSSAPGALMEMTTELTGFSSAPADASKFEIPSGFKQVESDMKKALR